MLVAAVVCAVPASAEVERAYRSLEALPAVRKALDSIRSDDTRTFEEQRKITEIPAPPFKESARAEYFRLRLQQEGLADARIDAEGNVIGVRKGRGKGPRLVLSAHLDSVFPEGTDVTVRQRDGRYFAPGIGDDSRGLAELLSVLRALEAADLGTVGDILFVGTVGEEELGNLRGAKALFRDHPDIDGFVSIDVSGVDRIINAATGSHRYEVVFKGPGGHSFQDFGTVPSATHAMGRAIARIAEIRTPPSPRTTFTVGTVGGGTSVNAIAGEARMTVDMRSDRMEELLELEGKVMEAIRAAVVDENARWGATTLKVESRLIGDRPAGTQPVDATIVQAARRSLQVLGLESARIEASSTDANIPIALGIPAVTIGNGGDSRGRHSLDESYVPTRSYLGPQNALLLVLGLVGVEGVTKPLLPTRDR